MEKFLPDKEFRGDSGNWANWMSNLSPTSCKYCKTNHGKVVNISALVYRKDFKINVHPNCFCLFVPMRTKKVGSATQRGANGPDVSLLYFKKLPNYYVTKAFAEDSGWVSAMGNLDAVLPFKMIGGDVFHNKAKKLPESAGRIWYEADIDYQSGYRNSKRILYSNDGLVFVSYDHYQTFYEITN